MIFQFSRTFILNGINIPAASPDLLDRSILIELKRIDDTERREKAELLGLFEKNRASILGGLLDAISAAMRIKDSVQLKGLPRMADWTRWGYAVAEALGIGGERFLEAYYQSIRHQHDEILNEDVVCTALLNFLSDECTPNPWRGTATALYQELLAIAEELKLDKTKTWPKGGSAISRHLARVQHTLLEAGISIERGKEGSGAARSRLITIEKSDKLHGCSDQSYDYNNGDLSDVA